MLLVALNEFAQVPEVVALHFQEEHLGFGVFGVGDQVVVQQSQHVIANVLQFSFDLRPVLFDQFREFGPLFIFISL